MSVIKVTKLNFESEVIKSEKPVLIDFCHLVRSVQNGFSIIDEIAEENPSFKVVKVDVDEQPELARDFGVMSIPTLVVVKDGKVVKNYRGAPEGCYSGTYRGLISTQRKRFEFVLIYNSHGSTSVFDNSLKSKIFEHSCHDLAGRAHVLCNLLMS